MHQHLAYTHLAAVYDQLMGDTAGFDAWMDFLSPYLKQHVTVCDLACGSGELSLRLAQQGHRVIGVDLSEDMLAVARKKDPEHRIEFQHQDMRCVKLNERIDVVVCAADSIHYLASIDQVFEMIDSVSHLLSDEGVFIFDLFQEPFVNEFVIPYEEEGKLDELAYVWTINYKKPHLLHTVALFYQDFPVVEHHVQTMFEYQKIMLYLEQSGFSVEVFPGLNEESIDEKWYVVAKKLKRGETL